MERKCNNIINVFNQTRRQIYIKKMVFYLSGKILDVLVVLRIFDTQINYQAPSERELLSLNDPTFCLQETYSGTVGSVNARRAATSYDIGIYLLYVIPHNLIISRTFNQQPRCILDVYWV